MYDPFELANFTDEELYILAYREGISEVESKAELDLWFEDHPDFKAVRSRVENGAREIPPAIARALKAQYHVVT